MTERKMRITDRIPAVFIAVVAAFIAMWFFVMKDGIRMFTSDGYIIDCALNIIRHGRIALSINGDMYRFNEFWLEYPPLFSIMVALTFKLFGVGYAAAKAFPFGCMIATLFVVFLFASRYTSRTMAGLITGLIAFDPLFFDHAMRIRPDCLTTLLFSTSVFLFFVNLEKKRLPMAVVTGATAGLAALTHFNMVWIMIIFGLYALLSLRDFKRMFAVHAVHTATFFVIIAPYALWILLNPELRSLFVTQVFLNTYLAKHPSMHFSYLKMALNPLANFYLILVQYKSFYPLVFAASSLYCLRHYRTHKYLLLALAVPFMMTMFNFRAAHYLLPTMGVCYAALAFYFPRRAEKEKAAALSRAGLALLAFIIAASVAVDLNRMRIDRGMLMDREYFTKVLEENTKPDSRIATEINLILCESGGRKVVNVGALIYDVWRIYYSFDDVARAIDPDYIVLTENKMKWARTEHPQIKEFNAFLDGKFEFVKKVEDGRHSTLWIYKRKGIA